MVKDFGRPVRLAGVVCAIAAALGVGAPAASAADSQRGGLAFAACGGQDPAVQCATLQVPLDYDRPDGKSYGFYFARVPATDQANKLGTLFFNFGGPGGDIASLFADYGARIFPEISSRYDIIAFDPRGTGGSEAPVDCKANQETEGIYSEPFVTPLNLDVRALLTKTTNYIGKCLANNRRDVLAHLSTANVARDMDSVRRALGLRKISYYGFSYGTFLGATYASLFPRNYDKMVLDGALDADQYINRPHAGLEDQTSGFERALGRFFQACVANQPACPFGGSDPWKAYDTLIERANTTPIPAPHPPAPYAADTRPVTGDDLINLTLGNLYAEQQWQGLSQILAAADAGDASDARAALDDYNGLQPDGSYSPSTDRYFTIGASEQDYDRNVNRYLRWGNNAWGEFDHFFVNSGYVELNYGLWPIRDRDAFYGPFKVPDGASTPLVVTNTYDPATPYNGARRLVRDLGNARLLKVRADGHTAYGLTGPCADAAINAYLLQGVLPAVGTTCDAVQPFDQTAPSVAAAGVATRRAVARATER